MIDGQHQALTQNATSLGLLGIVTVLWTASTLTDRAQRALGIVFGAPKRVIANRFRALGVTVGLGVTLIATLALTGLVVGLHVEGLLSFPLKVASFLVLLVIDIGYFTLAYWALTPMREIPHARASGRRRPDGVGWAILSYVGVYLVDRSISHASALYGALGTVFGLLLFIRLAMWLCLYGGRGHVARPPDPPRRRDGRRTSLAPSVAGEGSDGAPRRGVSTNGTLVSTARSSNRNRRLTNSAFWLCRGRCRHATHDELGDDHVDHRVGARGVPADLVQHRTGEVAERRLHDVERDLQARVEPPLLEPCASSGSRSK